MEEEKLRQRWNQEEQEPFSGWDFSHLNGRMQEEPLPWDYRTILESYRKKGQTILDMGTGGGEFLISLGPEPGKTYATEGYEPNVHLCREKLGPLGVDVRQVFDDDRLPFYDGFFDLVLNRHESFDTSEVYRIIKPGGFFITQQVGGDNNRALCWSLLGEHPGQYEGFDLHSTLEQVEKAGFHILDSGEAYPALRFTDVGALVFFAKVIPWEFPDFSVDKCWDTLMSLHRSCIKDGYIESQEHRFFIVAQKDG